jgi:methionine sulfoxide reductase heme-binding subunit
MALWYLSRATGATTLVLLTLTLALGVANVGRFTSPRFPRFLVDGWHRGVSLLTCALVAVHVTTTLLDGYAPIRLADAVIPFTSAYRPLWLGLGALGLDLLAALVITSLLRACIGLRGWRAVHWLAYACWPVALLHGLGTGSDVRPGWLTWLALGCAGTVTLAVVVRLADRNTSARARVLASGGLAAAALALLVWIPSGPMSAGWAARAGTPKSLLKGTKR